VKEGPANVAPGLAAQYASAFAAYLADPAERELGAAYDLGRQAVAEHLSVLDLAEAHHAAVRAALDSGTRGADATLQAGADFLRESLSIFESVHRGYHEVQEVARIEHQHVQQLRALADASVALNSTLTVEEILQITVDAARSLIGGSRATVAIFASDPRQTQLTATSPPLLADGGPAPARLSAGLTYRGRELGRLEVVDQRTREFSERDETILTQLAQLASVAISNAQLYERERTIAQTLQRSLRPGGLPDVPGLSAAVRFRPAGESIELGGDFYDLYEARKGTWAALIGDVQGKGPDAAAVTALARHTLRAARPGLVGRAACSRCCTRRCASSAATGASARWRTRTCRSPSAASTWSWPAAATRSRSCCTATAGLSPWAGSARCSARTSSRSSTTWRSSSRRATCSSSTPTA
jgi:hypothetical protein